MHIRKLGMLASLSMAVVGTTVYAITPAGGFGATHRREVVVAAQPNASDSAAPAGESAAPSEPSGPLSQFSAGSTVKIEGRLGLASLHRKNPEENFILIELNGDAQAAKEAPQVHLSIVIDKSGSMSGTRLVNAKKAAETAIARLNDGDTVSVVAFDTRTEVALAQTPVDSSSRSAAFEAVRSIKLGGDTCISCGLEEGTAQLSKPGSGRASVRRMLLLSDGAATAGVRDAAGFKPIAERAMSRGITVTTIGVDLGYNEAIMSAIALASNGRHYFAEHDRDLPAIFEAEAKTLSGTIASDAVAEIDLAPGVELVQLYDRSFERTGSRIRVPLGTFGPNEAKTVLARVRVPSNAGRSSATSFEVASVGVRFREIGSGKDVEEKGKLMVAFVDDGADIGELDPAILDREQRSETGNALNEANQLFNDGKTDAAIRRLEQAKQTLEKNRGKARHASPTTKAPVIDKSFERQESELNRAKGGFMPQPAPPPMATSMGPQTAPSPSPAPPAAPKPQVNVKRNAEAALPNFL